MHPLLSITSNKVAFVYLKNMCKASHSALRSANCVNNTGDKCTPDLKPASPMRWRNRETGSNIYKTETSPRRDARRDTPEL
jgi:hypothetical protein